MASDGWFHDIDATGEILNTLETNGTFDGVQGLSEHLAASSEVSACYVQQWFIFGTGVGDMEEPEAACGVEAAVERFTVDGATFNPLRKHWLYLIGCILAVVKSVRWIPLQGENKSLMNRMTQAM